MNIITSQSTPTTYGECGFSVKTLLVSAGWSVLESGTGSAGSGSLVYNSTGDAITTAALMNNTDAWFRIVSPLGASGPQFIFQNSVSGAYDIWFTCYGVASGGTASVPAILTTGAKIRDRNYQIFSTVPTNRLFVAADSMSPYGFWFGQFPVGGGAARGMTILAPLSVTNPGDTTPYMVISGPSTTNLLVTDISSLSNSFNAHNNYGYIPGTTNCTIIPGFLPTNQSFFGGSMTLCASITQVGGLGTDPITGKDGLFPIMFARSNQFALPCWKGVTSFMKLKGSIRATGDTATVSTTRDYIHMSDVVLPWDGSIPIL